MIIQTILLLPW